MSSLWSAFGLRGNPFFQDELSPEPEARHPVRLLVGRAQELATLRAHIVGETHSRVIVEGRAGVGKTSVVNRLKADLAEAGYLTHVTPVRVESAMTTRDFIAEVFRELLRMRTRVLPTPNAVVKAGRRLVTKEARAAAAFWDRVERVLVGATATGWGVSAGVPAVHGGVQAQVNHAPAEVPISSLFDLFADAVERLRTEAGADVVLHVNNLENLSDHDAAHAARLIRDVRDYLKVPGAHWIFVGTTGVERLVFRASAQVSGFFPAAVTLEPLAAATVERMLQERYAYLRAGARRVTPPVDPAAVPPLYELFRGDLRNFLRMLHEAAVKSPTAAAGRALRAADVRAVVQGLYAQKLRADLGDAVFGHLMATVVHPEWAGEFRQVDMKKRAKIEGPAAKRAIDMLRQRHLITLTRTAGQSEFFTVSGEVAVALGLGRGGA